MRVALDVSFVRGSLYQLWKVDMGHRVLQDEMQQGGWMT